jgi:hypothetical protein
MLTSNVVCHSSSLMSPMSLNVAELVDGALNDRLAVFGITDVAGDEDGLASLFLHQRLHLLRVFVFTQIGDQYVRALAC